MKWFKKLSLANKLAFITVIVAIITLIFSIFPINREEKILETSTKQETEGNYSPAINTDGDVNINY